MSSTVYLVRGDQITRVSPDHAARHAPHLPTFATLAEAQAARLRNQIADGRLRRRAFAMAASGVGGGL